MWTCKSLYTCGTDWTLITSHSWTLKSSQTLKALDTDEVYFELIDELSPGVLKTNEPFLYVIMPMRMS